jgi:hypothetical protein
MSENNDLKQRLQAKKNKFKHQRAKKTKQAKSTNELYEKIVKMKDFVYKEDPPEWIIEERYSSIKEKYPMLYDMIVEKRVDMQILTNMFVVMEQMELKKLSPDNADKYVGQQLANTFVKPIVDEMDNEKSS